MCILSVVIFIILMSGCVQPKREKVPVQILDRELLAKAKVLQADTMGTFDEFIYAKKFWVYADSILIVLNKKHKDGYFVELHNLFTKENIVKLYRFGDGPDEILSARVDMNGKTLRKRASCGCEFRLPFEKYYIYNSSYSTSGNRKSYCRTLWRLLFVGKSILFC